MLAEETGVRMVMKHEDIEWIARAAGGLPTLYHMGVAHEVLERMTVLGLDVKVVWMDTWDGQRWLFVDVRNSIGIGSGIGAQIEWALKAVERAMICFNVVDAAAPAPAPDGREYVIIGGAVWTKGPKPKRPF